MARVNIVLGDEVLSELRTHLPAKRGALSRFVEDAVIEKLEREKEEK